MFVALYVFLFFSEPTRASGTKGTGTLSLYHFFAILITR